jgi:hypothetical protein
MRLLDTKGILHAGRTDFHPAAARDMMAQQQGLARLEKTWDELYEGAKAKIQGARAMLDTMMEQSLIEQNSHWTTAWPITKCEPAVGACRTLGRCFCLVPCRLDRRNQCRYVHLGFGLQGDDRLLFFVAGLGLAHALDRAQRFADTHFTVSAGHPAYGEFNLLVFAAK